MFESVAEREELIKNLNKAVLEAKNRGRELAEAERHYKVANAKMILELKDKKYPATLILELCKGDPNIAQLRYNRDTYQVLYKTALEAINVFKLQIRVLDNEIQNERRGM